MAERLTDERRRMVEDYLAANVCLTLLRHWNPGTVSYARAAGLSWGEIDQACKVGVCEAASRWDGRHDLSDRAAGWYVVGWMRHEVQAEARARLRHRGRGLTGAEPWEVRESDLDREFLELVLERATAVERQAFMVRYGLLFGSVCFSEKDTAGILGVGVNQVRWAVKKVVGRCRNGLNYKPRSM